MASHTFTRKELYDLVWSEPMIKLGVRYNISGNGLAKACRRADIPVPPRGYWARKAAGKKVTQTPLPPAKVDTLRSVTIEPPGKQLEPSPPPPPPQSVQEKIEAAKQSGKPVTVPKTLSSPHWIVQAWLDEDRRERQASRHDPYWSRLHTPVDKTELDKRRLRILSALFKALEDRGYKLITDSNRYVRQVQIEHDREKFVVSLEERIKQVRRQLTDEDRKKRSFLFRNQKWTQEKIPTGELILKITEPDRYGISREWRDEPDAPMESKLDDVLAQIAGIYEELRLRRIREAEARERQRKIEEERYRAEKERKREVVRTRRLVRHCEDWRLACDVRAFITAVESSPLAAEKADEFASWKSWALDHVERLDPLQNKELFSREVSDYEIYALKVD
jgi:hypothetical protein